MKDWKCPVCFHVGVQTGNHIIMMICRFCGTTMDELISIEKKGDDDDRPKI